MNLNKTRKYKIKAILPKEGWSLFVPLHLEEPAKYYFMNHLNFVKKNVKLFLALAAVAKIRKLDIERDMTDNDFPHIGSAHGGSHGEGMYLRIRQYHGLAQDQYDLIEQLFPLSIEGFDIKLHSIADFEYDDDRMWRPSVQFGIYKRGINVLDGTLMKYALNHQKKINLV